MLQYTYRLTTKKANESGTTDQSMFSPKITIALENGAEFLAP